MKQKIGNIYGFASKKLVFMSKVFKGKQSGDFSVDSKVDVNSAEKI